MPITELLVSLKVPDNVAITAFQTLHRMGRHHLKNLERADYYIFSHAGDIKNFQKRISKADILINANKHKFSFVPENDGSKINVLVQNLDGDSGLLKTLRERLGFKEIKKLEKGVLWTMYFDSGTDGEKKAAEITKGLLMNDNSQSYRIIK
jgi:phosphoribosylformylglycinamidine (FGAM) synthase PurS component